MDECQSACATPTTTQVPGPTGATGAAGADGADGVSAVSVLASSAITLPGVAGPVTSPATVTVDSTAWIAIGQIIIISSDSTHIGSFQVLTRPTATTMTLQWLAYPNDSAGGTVIPIGARVSPAGVRPALAASLPAALTDNSTGTQSNTIAAGVGIITIPLFVNLVDVAAADLLTTYTPGYKFKILSVDFAVEKAVTTAAKAATLTPKITGVAVTGGVLSLTSAACTPQGKVVNGSAVTGLNTGTNSDTISITGSAVTAFIEGAGWILIRVQNMDTADAVASLAKKVNDIRTALNF